MAYKFTTGSVKRGDIYAETTEDADADTYIDFDEDYIALATNGSSTFVVNGAQVGIGTVTPGTDLHVKADDARIRIDSNTNSHPGLELSENGTRKWIVYNNYTNDNLTFKTNSADRMVIEQDGNVGIGTTSPVSTFEVQGSQGGKYTAVSSTGTTALGATHFVVDYTGNGAATFTLPATSGCTGRMYHIICNNQDSNAALIIDANSTEKISGVQVETGEQETITIDGATPQSVSIVSQ